MQDDQVIENVEKNIQEESEEKTEKEKQVASPERKEEEYDAGEEENVEPLVVKLTRDGHTYVDIQLEPGKDTEALGCFSIEGLNEEAISKLSETHKSRLCKHIEEIQDKLEILKKNFK